MVSIIELWKINKPTDQMTIKEKNIYEKPNK